MKIKMNENETTGLLYPRLILKFSLFWVHESWTMSHRALEALIWLVEPIYKSLVESIKILKKSDFSPSKFQLVGDVIGCCRSLVRLSVIFTGIYVSVTFVSPIVCHHFIIQNQAIQKCHIKWHNVNNIDANVYSAWFY